MPLTTSQIDSANPRDKVYRIRDDLGLYLEATPKGYKWWRLRYWIGGKGNMLSLGVYPAVNLEEARSRRDETRKLIAQGIDPGELKKALKAGLQEERARAAAAIKSKGSMSPLKVSVFTDGQVEIWKGKNVIRLSPDEARQISDLLKRLLQEEGPRAVD